MAYIQTISPWRAAGELREEMKKADRQETADPGEREAGAARPESCRRFLNVHQQA